MSKKYRVYIHSTEIKSHEFSKLVSLEIRKVYTNVTGLSSTVVKL